jgi:hypothetical protein
VTFWDKAPCSLLSDYSGFGRICYIDLNLEVNMEAEGFTETSLTASKTGRCHNTIDHVLNFTTEKVSNLTSFCGRINFLSKSRFTSLSSERKKSYDESFYFFPLFYLKVFHLLSHFLKYLYLSHTQIFLPKCHEYRM